ncbi:hypothetical protein D9M68_843680 [compost metagenome]
MNGINRHIVLNGRNGRSLHMVCTVQAFQPSENKGVMGHNKVTAFPDGLQHHLLRHIEADQYPRDLCFRMPDQEAGVIVIFLKPERGQLLQMSGKFPDLHFICIKI